jgi:hypothetical protein
MSRYQIGNREMVITVEGVDYHRNGIGGAGFHVVAFRWAETDDEPRAMVGVVFEGRGQVAVFDREQLRHGNIFMHADDARPGTGGNAWRGDHFEPALREAVAQYAAGSDERIQRAAAELAATLRGRGKR